MDPLLAEKITQLRVAIEETGGLPLAQREQLLQSLADLEELVAAGGELPPLLERWEESVLELEAKHPGAAQLLQGLADVLGRIGL